MGDLSLSNVSAWSNAASFHPHTPLATPQGLQFSTKVIEGVTDDGAIDDEQDEVSLDPFAPELSMQSSACSGEMPTDSQLQASAEASADTVSTLLRHQDKLEGDLSRESLEKMLAEKKDLPDDLRQAVNSLLANPELYNTLDAQRDGGKLDGVLGVKDLLDLAKNDPAYQQRELNKSESYTHNYVPSDAPADAKPREITTQDAVRELYMYSDSLPKKIDLDSLKAIADGTAEGGKIPAQVRAAAKHLVDNPEEWRSMMGGDRVKRGDFCDRAASNINLSPDSRQVAEDLKKDSDFFFSEGAITRDQLNKWKEDPNVSDERKKTIDALLKDDMLFGMLDNAKNGHSGGGFFSKYKADDGKIGKGDLDHFLGNMTEANRTSPKPPPPHGPETKADANAVNDMRAGWADDPDAKRPKGNGGFFKITAKILEIGSRIADIQSVVLGALAKIPVFGVIAAAASVAMSAYAGALRVGKTAIEGGDVKEALKNMGLDIAGAAIGAVAAPGSGKALITAAREITEVAVKAGAQKGAKAGASEIADHTVFAAAPPPPPAAAPRGRADTFESYTPQAYSDQEDGAIG